MKLDILKSQWLELVFEGRNKSYGAYELRKRNPKNTFFALFLGGFIFSLAISIPLIIDSIPSSLEDDSVTIDQKILTVKLPPKDEPVKKEPPKELPPPPQIDQVKFVKPVVAKADEVTEEPPKVVDLKDKHLGDETIKGDPNAALSVEPAGHGDANAEPEDTTVYSAAGIEVVPTFPGGMEKFYKFIANNYVVPDEEFLKGRIFVSFVVEKDGSLSDIKVLRDIGFGTGKEAVRVLKMCPRWTPGEQNGKKARVLYSLPINIQSAE